MGMFCCVAIPLLAQGGQAPGRAASDNLTGGSS
jgi:hypothetical protein